MSRELADFEKQVYEFIKEREEVLISSIPARMRGAIPGLKKAGLIEIFKKRTVPWSPKKRKFVKVLVVKRRDLKGTWSGNRRRG